METETGGIGARIRGGASPRDERARSNPVFRTRRALLRRIAAAAGASLVLGASGLGAAMARAQHAHDHDSSGHDRAGQERGDHGSPAGHPDAGSADVEAAGDAGLSSRAAPALAAPPAALGGFAYSLATREECPVREGGFKSKEGVEIGYGRFDGDGYVIHVHPYRKGTAHREEWVSTRIGDFSFRDGALLVDARDEAGPNGAFALEMRRQQYKDRRYIRSNWLWVHPATRHVHIQSDGIWNSMEKLDEDPGTSGAVQPPGHWNRLLFLARGTHLEGWVNGQQVVRAQDGRWGSGQISLVALRRDEAEFRVRFRNLRVWPNEWPDPAAVWDGLDSPPESPDDAPPPAPHHH